jgi:solute carrier family 10 (sodium/bile acid cotransporter), member 7
VIARLFPDRFVLILLATLALASWLPARGETLALFSVASNVAIFSLFFFHGLRLSHQSVVQGVRHWRLQLAAMVCVFGLMPLLGLALWLCADEWVSPALWIGIFFLCALPSTVQSAISSTSMAGGNVAASVIIAALTNLAGVIITPLVFSVLAQLGTGSLVDASAIGRIASLLLLPFMLGQIAQIWLSKWAARQKSVIALLDRGTILFTVFVSFSAAVNEGLWQRLNLSDVLWLTLLILILLLTAFALCWGVGRLMGLNRADRISLLFAGAHKSLATGAPMARILFPAAQAGVIIVPLMLYHQLQLILSSWMAAHLAREQDVITLSPTETIS